MPCLKAQTTHMRPMKPPTKTKESKIMTMFWKKVKSDDQNMVCSNIKIAQTIPATIVITIGINGLASFLVMTTHVGVKPARF